MVFLQGDKGTMYGQQLRSSSASVLPHRGSVNFYLQLNVDGEVRHQLDRLHYLLKGATCS